MREIRLHGSEGGGTETNRSSLPLSGWLADRSVGRAGLVVWPTGASAVRA